jgi:hypothetical protein
MSFDLVISAFKSEFRKFVSTKIWWIMLLVGFGYVAFNAAAMGGLFGFLYKDSGGAETVPAEEFQVLLDSLYSIGISTGFIFPALVGALAVTTEFRYKTITPSFLSDPNRPRVLFAKLISAFPIGAMHGLVITAATVIVGGGLLAVFGAPTGLDQGATWELLGRSILALAIWAMVGVGVGVLIPNQVASIVVLIGFTVLLDPILRVIPLVTDKEWIHTLLNFMPGAASNAIVSDVSIYSSITATDLASTSTGGLPMWGGILVMLGYAAVFSLAGYFAKFRRDVG